MFHTSTRIYRLQGVRSCPTTSETPETRGQNEPHWTVARGGDGGHTCLGWHILRVSGREYHIEPSFPVWSRRYCVVCVGSYLRMEGPEGIPQSLVKCGAEKGFCLRAYVPHFLAVYVRVCYGIAIHA